MTDDKIVIDQFHWHEALDRASVVANLFDTAILDHPVIMQVEALRNHAGVAAQALHDLYQMIGASTPPEDALSTPARS